jgi:HD-GYP domain-containing protein (c-di-GMP phosphodiesterase class II)
MAAPAALAIENAQLFEDTRRRLAELEILQSIASALRVATTLDETIPIILNQLISQLNVGAALLDLLDPSSREIVTVLADGIWAPVTGMRTSEHEGVSGHVISTGQAYVTTDVIADGLIAGTDLVGGLNSVASVPISAGRQPIGALWVGRKSEEPITQEEVDLLHAIGEMVGNTIQRMKLHEQTLQQTLDLGLAYDSTLEGWAKALELRDRETEGHSRRVTNLTLKLAKMMGISDAELIHVQRGVLLHDIGKMGVPDHILNKTGKLDEQEWDEMKKHPLYAYELIYPIDYLRPAIDIPYCHHEKWDGSGYPRGLKGEEIPLAARIFAVIDVWDALRSDRPYRKAWSDQETITYIKENAATHFDPSVVRVFFQLMNT